MDVALWIAQILLALMFVAAGVMKATRPKDALEPSLPWVADFSASAVRLIGVAEILGGLGLVLPAATGIATVLTPLAAVGLAVVMVGAIVVHARRSEPQMIVVNLVLLTILLLVAWGRFGPYAF